MKKIAIIDDQVEVLNMIERFLGRQAGIQVSVFSNPEKALNDVKKGVFDAVLLDIHMPQIDGLKFLKTVRNYNSKTKIVIMTSDSNLNKVLDSHREGADYFLTKPFKSLDAVLEAIK